MMCCDRSKYTFLVPPSCAPIDEAPATPSSVLEAVVAAAVEMDTFCLLVLGQLPASKLDASTAMSYCFYYYLQG